MGNPQGTPSEAEIAWLSGVIEGEGSLALSAWNRRDEHASRNPKISVTVKIYNTDAAIISKCVEILGKLGINPHLKEREQRPIPKRDGGEYKSVDPMLTLTVSKLDTALRLVRTVRPWLFGNKAARAELIVSYLERRLAKVAASGSHRQCPYDDEDIGFVEQFYALTKRGQFQH